MRTIILIVLFLITFIFQGCIPSISSCDDSLVKDLCESVKSEMKEEIEAELRDVLREEFQQEFDKELEPILVRIIQPCGEGFDIYEVDNYYYVPIPYTDGSTEFDVVSPDEFNCTDYITGVTL